MRSYATYAVLLVTLLLPACGGNEAPPIEPVRNAATPVPVKAISGRPLTLDELVNATYIGTDNRLIELKNGEWTDPAANRKITLLRTSALSGDLNGDGTEESVGFYSDRIGAVETFNFAVLVWSEGKIHVIASATVGTGVALVSARIAEQKIVVEVRSNAQNQKLEWEMKDGVLKQIGAP